MKPLTLDHCIDVAIANNGFCLSTKYKNNRTYMKWCCEQGHIWEAPFERIGRGWCMKCGGCERLTIEECREYAISRNGVCLSAEYENAHTKMEWRCSVGHRWFGGFGQMKSKRSWCDKCADIERSLSISECTEIANSRGGRCLSTEYTNNDTLMIWECEKGHTWETSFSNIKHNDSWCKDCWYDSIRSPIDVKTRAKISREKNKDKVKITKQIYEKENAEKIAIRKKEYREKNKEMMRLKERERTRKAAPKAKERHKNRLKTDPSYKIACNLRTRIYNAVKKGKSGSAVNDLGCSIEFLVQHLESQFYPDRETGEMMSWENYGRWEGKWNIDHIVPLSSFDLTDKEQFLKAAHYTNLQPLWFDDNMRKGDKLNFVIDKNTY